MGVYGALCWVVGSVWGIVLRGGDRWENVLVGWGWENKWEWVRVSRGSCTV